MPDVRNATGEATCIPGADVAVMRFTFRPVCAEGSRHRRAAAVGAPCGTATREVIPDRTARRRRPRESGAGTAFPATRGVASARLTQHQPARNERAKRANRYVG